MMKYKYYIIPPAREEFLLAREWYQQQQVRGLSNHFAQAVKMCIAKIRKNPFAYIFVIKMYALPIPIYFLTPYTFILMTKR